MKIHTMRGYILLIGFLFSGMVSVTGQYLYKANSDLAVGDWFRLGVMEDGVYVLRPSDLVQMGAGANIPINNIHIYGYGGSMLPERNGDANPDDLLKNPIKVYDQNGNGIFDGSDYLLFYGKEPGEWYYRSAQALYSYRRNIYVDTSYYYVGINASTPNHIQDVLSVSGTPDYTVATWDDFMLMENDSLNINYSGRRWFWRDLKYTTSQTVSASTAGSFIADSLTKMRVMLSSRCVGCSSSFSVSANGQSLGTVFIGSTNPEYAYSVDGERIFSFPFSGSTMNVNVTRTAPQGQGVDAWLDFVEVNGRKLAQRVSNQQHFQDRYTLGKTLARYQVGNSTGCQIWDVTNVTEAKNVLHTSGSFSFPGDVLRRFIVFENNGFKSPFMLGRVKNQNLHGLGYADNLIVTHPLFYEQAKRLGDFHLQKEGISYHLVTVDQVYNEFSSGMQDATAIRNFVRMFWQRSQDGEHPMPKYLTLFGDASYDTKTHLNRSYKDSSGIRVNINSNFVPAWQTYDSYSISGGSFSTDDYYGVMKNGRGANNGDLYIDYLQIGIGRILARTVQEATYMVDKVIHYEASKECMGDWRNRVMLMIDDEDEPNPDAFFFPITESLDNIIQTDFPVYNVDKLYLDAYQQVVTAGQRYPDAEKALVDKINHGQLVINFIGHGGEKGITKERVMQTDDIEKWDTYNKLPLWITATCTFTRYDDPHIVSAGEYVLTKPDGGGIALMSTSRPISPSGPQSRAYIRSVFAPDTAGNMPRLGDIVKNAKNNSGGINGIQPLLLLFGDPALQLAYPKENIFTETITDEYGNLIDTLKATQVVKITGNVKDNDGFTMGDFNGWVYPTVFDKPSKMKTRQNDPAALERHFEIQKNILFKGKAKVVNGHFEFEFKLPQDIDYKYGLGKISYYAENGFIDAHGYDTVVIGGSENNCVNDETGPSIVLSLNDSLFSGGGVSNAHPVVYARLFDESGINLSGAGIGHDLMLTLDGPVNQEYIVNDFYLSDPGNYRSGILSYRLRDLPQGDYVLSLRAWDGCTNSATATLAFTVDTSRLVVNNLFNYPNPTNGGTTFSFEHNYAETDLDVDLRIHSIDGALVGQIKRTVNSGGFRNVELYWDGNSVGGARLAPGMYIYALYVSNGKGKAVRASNKLIITE